MVTGSKVAASKVASSKVTSSNKKSRRQHILESFAHMLEAGPGTRITTAALAKEVGVSEAALYRHFPSKTKMFEGLIEFIEDAIFTRVSLIEGERDISAVARCEKILFLLLAFAERNAGITRILTGDAISGETSRLHQRVIQFFDRIESQLKKILREAELSEGLSFKLSVASTAKVWLATAEGRIAQFVRSQFRDLPTSEWKTQWPCFVQGFVSSGYATHEASEAQREVVPGSDMKTASELFKKGFYS